MNLYDSLMDNPVIGAISTDSQVNGLCEVYFVLSGSIIDLRECIDRIKDLNKMVFIHMDLIKGIKSDVEGLRYIKSLNPSGIITTHGQLVDQAKKMGLLTVQRLFLIDSKNLQSGLKSVHKYKPDAVEVLPGALHKVTEKIIQETKLPVITGGLILDKEDIINALKVGAVGVSTSTKDLWSL